MGSTKNLACDCSEKSGFLLLNFDFGAGRAMDADSWSTGISSASKRYHSALQARSGELNFVNFLFFPLSFALAGGTSFWIFSYFRLD